MNKIDFQGLLNVIKAAENEPNLQMRVWRVVDPHGCGTSNCMIGAFCKEHPDDILTMEGSLIDAPSLRGVKQEYGYKHALKAISQRFGLTIREACFLFTGNHTYYQHVPDAMQLDKERALNRLRKFIYYKLHKSEMTLDEGRRVSGNLATMRAANKVLAYAKN